MKASTRLRTPALLGVLISVSIACGGAGGGGEGETYTLGVSNTLVGNGWREQMICAIKAEALASGVVDEVVVVNENADTTGQIGHIENLISQGVDAIIINPTDREGLNSVIEEAIAQGIVVVAVDQAVTAEGAYVVTNDQEEYGYLGAKWLFEQIGGEGNVVEMRGIDGVPADTDRHEGFMRALEEFPGINVSQETFTGWDPTVGAQQALDIISAGDVDGIWTSGIDYTVVEQFQTANADLVPIVGADNNGFIAQLLEVDGLEGAAVTNPPAIGGVGAAVAIAALKGENPDQVVTLTPEVFDHTEESDLNSLYDPEQQVGWSTYVEIAPWTNYEAAQVSECAGPGE
ncbi:MAG TPA: substrate-binding domain-containing protein [Acidimicrobiia bacterium]|nr:substrate-binding domain-containing protein [Acidimicrobiia bacterium]